MNPTTPQFGPSAGPQDVTPPSARLTEQQGASAPASGPGINSY